MPKTKYYRLDNILKAAPDAQYYMIIGQRSNGKTYAVLEYLLKQYFENGSEFAIIRRWHDDFKGRRGNMMFNALETNSVIQKLSGGTWTNIAYKSMQFYLSRYEDGKLIMSERPIGYAFAVSQMEHDKSTSYNVKNILFDEFLTRSEYGYLNNEFVLFMNVVSTIIRERGESDKVKIFMCANTVNFTCPYFNEMGLKNIKKMQPGTIDVYDYGESGLQVAVEYTEQYTGKKNSNKFFAFDNPRLKMITGDKSGSWEIDIYPHLPFKYTPCNVIFTYFIVFDGVTLQCEVIEKEGNVITYIHRKTTELKHPDSDIIFSTEYDARPNWNRNILDIHNQNIRKVISCTFNPDKIFFQDNELGEYLRNYLIWCKQN